MTTLRDLFPRRRLKCLTKCDPRFSVWGGDKPNSEGHEPALEGPYGYICLRRNGEEEPLSLWVVVGITSTRLKKRTEKLVQDPKLDLVKSEEYWISLDLSAVSLALELVGLPLDRRG